MDDAGHGQGQCAPIVGTDGLGDDFREDENEQGENGGDECKRHILKNALGFGTYACGTDGVGNGVEGQNSG